jgi:hypothetical protein
MYSRPQRPCVRGSHDYTEEGMLRVYNSLCGNVTTCIRVYPVAQLNSSLAY